jgi:hypothetical protein
MVWLGFVSEPVFNHHSAKECRIGRAPFAHICQWQISSHPHGGHTHSVRRSKTI